MKLQEALSDPLLCQREPRIFEAGPAFNPNKPLVLIYASCHGRNLALYLNSRHDFTEAFNWMRIETGPILLTTHKGVDVFGNQAMRTLFDAADVIVTYNMGARHGQLALESVRRFTRPETKWVTFTAPNCSCFWPLSYGYAADVGIFQAYNKGHTPDLIWASFMAGDFDPFFAMRWRLEIGRLTDKDTYHDVHLAQFVVTYVKKVKLWLSCSHPTYVTMAYLGSKILERLGFKEHKIDEILTLDNTLGIHAAYAETDYEWNHFGFQYPKTEKPNDLAYYRPIFENWICRIKAGAFTSPPAD